MDLITRIQKADFPFAEYILPLILLVVVSCVVAAFCGIYSTHRCGKNNLKKTICIFTLLTVAAVVLTIAVKGISAFTVRLAVYTVVTLCAAYQDICSRESDNYYHVMILLAGLIGIDTGDFILRVAGTAVIGLALCAVILVTKGIGFGGGDYKYLLCTVFTLGALRGLVGIIVGLILGAVINKIKANSMGIRGKNFSYPLLPYLTIGTILAGAII